MKSILNVSLIVFATALVSCGKDEIINSRADLREQDGKELVGSFSSGCEAQTKHTLTLEGGKFRHETISFLDDSCSDKVTTESYSGEYTVASTQKAIENSILVSYTGAYTITYHLAEDLEGNQESGRKSPQELLEARIKALTAILEENAKREKPTAREISEDKATRAQRTALVNLPAYKVDTAQAFDQIAAAGMGMNQANLLNTKVRKTYSIDANILFIMNLELTRN